MDKQAELERLYEICAGFRAEYVECEHLKHIKDDLHMLVNRDNSGSEGAVMTLLGVPGSGKTQLINSFAAEYPRERHAISYPGPDGRKADRASVVIVNMPDSGVKSVLQATYEAITQSQLRDARRYDLEDDIAHSAAEQQTKLVIFEEAHDASVDDTSKTLKAVARLLRRMSNKALFSILIVGTEEAAQLVRSNKELFRRHHGFHTIKPLDWDDLSDRTFFQKLLRTWDKLLQAGFKPSGLAKNETAAKIWLASGGVIGLAAQLLERAGTLAARDVIADRADCITEAHLHAAHELLDFAPNNPFAPPRTRLSPEVEPEQKAKPAVRLSGRRAAPDRNFRP